MQWLECSTLAEAEAVDAIAEVFSQWGQGVAIEEPVESSLDGEVVRIDPTRPVLVKTYLPVDERAEDRRARLDEAIWHLGQLRSVTPLRVISIQEQDWANAWKEHFHVHRVSRRLVIVPSWRSYQAEPGDIELLLDPGMAFGTGLHPTTRLCLRAAEDLVQAGMTVLDLGCGSGILAIAAARLGAADVRALDIEAVAVEVARENVSRNSVASLVRVEQGSLPAPLSPPGSIDLVLANITIRALSELLGRIGEVLKPGGLAVLSGVLAEAAPKLIGQLEAEGWGHQGTEQEGDWVAIVARRGMPDALASAP